jgi:SSS family solute:Na+ symporter
VAIATGLAVGVAINYFFQFSGVAAPFEINAGIMGLLANIVVVIALTYLTSPQDKGTVDEYVDASDDQEYLEKQTPDTAKL